MSSAASSPPRKGRAGRRLVNAVGPMLFAAMWLVLGARVPEAEPLIMEGKTSLYERVLMRSVVPRREEPGGAATAGAPTAPVEPYYVYARRDAGGQRWLQVGAGTRAERLFWVPEADTIPWRQNIVLTFTNRGEPDRVLILEDLDTLYEVIESEDPGLSAARLRKDAEAREAALKRGLAGPEANGVAALGPATGIDKQQNFYVMPILAAEEALLETGGFINLLQVAVAKSSNGRQREEGVRSTRADSPFAAGVVFVVDTTLSMGPYIDATRAVVADMYDRLRTSPVGEHIAFGLIGFRDAPSVAPGVEYRVRRFVDLPEGRDEDAFLRGIAAMTEADAPTRGFNEDSFAGVSEAIDGMRWDDFQARFIILITDAGPRLAPDPLAGTSLSAAGLANYANESTKTAIAVLHLKTPMGKKTHQEAEISYRQLSGQTNIGDLYYGVPDGEVRTFAGFAAQLAAVIVEEIGSAVGGEPSRNAAAPPGLDPDQAALLDRVRQVARAMHLDYLGAQTGEDAPDVFSGWLADRDFDRPGIKPVEVRLLLTKNQLSDLEEALQIIIRQGEENLLEPELFFRQVLAAAADMSRQPQSVARRAETLADAALIREYLDGLPYTSHVMNITEEDWLRLSIAEQQEIIDLLTDKVERYKAFHDTPELWFHLQRDDPSGESVYPMLLDDLP